MKDGHRLMDLVESLHMSMTGSSDPMLDSEEREVADKIRERLASWTVSKAWWEPYDEAMRMVCVRVLEEYDAGHSVWARKL